MEMLQLGTCKVDITPTFPVKLAGFALRYELGPFEKVERPLHARIFVFANQGWQEGGRSGKTALLVSADLLWWGSDRVPALKSRIREMWGIDEDAILFHATHTHSGPQTSERFTSYLGTPDTRYLEQLEETVLNGIEQALRNMEPVCLTRGSSSFELGINRRSIVKNPPQSGPVDHDVNVIRFVTRAGHTKGVLVHYACHPVISQNNTVSAEYPGVATGLIEEALGPGAVAGFLQGTCGDVNPGDGLQVLRGDDKLVFQTGRALAEKVLHTLHGPLVQLEPTLLHIRKEVVELPLQRLPTRAELIGGIGLPGVEGEWHRIQLERWERLEPTIPMELTSIRLAEGLTLLGMNAEIVMDYGLMIKRLSGFSVLPLAYTNGMFGYVTTAEQLKEGGYEPQGSTIYFAMPSPFHPEVENVVKAALTNLVMGKGGFPCE